MDSHPVSLITTINCSPADPIHSMNAVKKHYCKTDKVLGLSIIQSFAPTDPVNALLVHDMGIQTIKSLLGSDYQAVVTTHVNTKHLHNHFLINPISLSTGKKLSATFTLAYRIREASNKICSLNKCELTSFEHTVTWEKNERWLTKAGRPTKKSIFLSDLEYCQNLSDSELKQVLLMKDIGYTFSPQDGSFSAIDWNCELTVFSTNVFEKELSFEKECSAYTDIHPEHFLQPQNTMEHFLISKDIPLENDIPKFHNLSEPFLLFKEYDNHLKENQINNRSLHPNFRRSLLDLPHYEKLGNFAKEHNFKTPSDIDNYIKENKQQINVIQKDISELNKNKAKNQKSDNYLNNPSSTKKSITSLKRDISTCKSNINMALKTKRKVGFVTKSYNTEIRFDRYKSILLEKRNNLKEQFLQKHQERLINKDNNHKTQEQYRYQNYNYGRGR